MKLTRQEIRALTTEPFAVRELAREYRVRADLDKLQNGYMFPFSRARRAEVRFRADWLEFLIGDIEDPRN